MVTDVGIYLKRLKTKIPRGETLAGGGFSDKGYQITTRN
jgi:hypothetical protein